MKRWFAISFFLAMVLSACSPSQTDMDAAVQTAIANTKVIENALATLVAQTATANQPIPTSTDTPTPPPPDPTAMARSNTNCRSGPAASFENLAMIIQGEGGRIIAKNTAGITHWYKLELPDGMQCWTSGDFLDISGDTSNIIEISSQSTPTSLPPFFSGTWNIWWRTQPDMKSPFAQATMTCTTAGEGLTCTFTSGGGCKSTVRGLIVDGTTMLGELTKSCVPGSWSIRWVKLNENQFGGSWWVPSQPASDGDWCGARAGAFRPDPCKH